MTISSTTRKAGPYAGNDVAVSFPFAFKVFAAADVLVVFTSASNVETVLMLTTNYTVSLNSNQDTNPGGTVTLLTSLATGEKLTLSSAVANLQPVDLTNNGGFYPSVINKALDRSTIQIQQLAEKVSRALVWPISSAGATLPEPAASKFIGWNATADSLVNLEGVAVGDAQNVASNDGASGTLWTTVAGFISRLMSSVGSSVVGFEQSGTGAVTRNAQDKMRESVSVFDFSGVDPTGVADSTAGIQAIVNAHNRVLVPAGEYLVTSPITFPDGVSLHGESWTPDAIDKGAVFICRGTFQFLLGKGSSVSNLSVVYDTQNYTTFVTFPATFVPNSCSLIENINYVGGTHFCVQDTTTYIEKPIIRNIYGCPLSVGISLWDTVDTAKINTIHFNPNSLRHVGVTESTTPSIASVSAQMQQSAEFIKLGRTDWTQISDVFCYGYKIGVHQGRRELSDTVASGGFSIVNFGFDYCNTAFTISRPNTPFPYTICNGWATPLVVVTGEPNCFIKLYGPDTRGVSVLANNVKAYGAVTAPSVAPAVNYIIDATSVGTINNEYNKIVLSNYEFQHNTGALVSGFTAPGSGVLFGVGVAAFNPHGVFTDSAGIISTNNNDGFVGVTFLNSWATPGYPFHNLVYFKDNLGYVHIQGVAVQGNIGLVNTAIFQLPAGFRPQSVLDVLCSTDSGAVAAVRIYSDGNVQQLSGSTANITISFSFQP